MIDTAPLKGDWFTTWSGIKMYPLDPRPEMISMTDIAHALANICRFGGHARRFYSVAQHSVLVSAWASDKNQLWGLLHDAAEAYLGDMVTPVKYSPVLDQYRMCEEQMMRCIAARFGLAWPQPEEITFLGKQFLITEARDLGLLTDDPEWVNQIDIYGYVPTSIRPLPPGEAEEAFHDWFITLTSKNR